MLVLLMKIMDKIDPDTEPSTVYWAMAMEGLLDAFVASLVIMWVRATW